MHFHKYLKFIPWVGSLLLHAGMAAIPLGLGDTNALFPAGTGLDFTFERTAPSSLQKSVETPAALPAAMLKTAKAEMKTPEEQREDAVAREPDRSEQREETAGLDISDADTEASAELSTDRISTDIGWQSSARTLKSMPAFPFPKVLSAAGQEVDCEARITVSELGNVTKVEIIRSSGYTEIDASVLSALRGYVFSRDYASGRKEAIGTVQFRFRLEKPD